MAKKQNTPFTCADGYRFVDPDTGTTTAILDQSGRLSLKDDGGKGSLEVFDSWQDFVKSIGDAPVKSSDEQDIFSQLSNMGLGRCEPIYREAGNSTPRPAPTEGKEDAMAEKVKQTNKKLAEVREAKKAQKKAAAKPAKKEAAPKELKDCMCGCGEQVARNFKQGHDARFHGWEKKIARGDMKFSDIETKFPEVAIKNLKAAGVKQGTKAKDAA